MTTIKIIDIHNHSLPNIDDGAKDLSMSIEMLKVAASHGTTDIVLTPHHLNGAFTNFANNVVDYTESLCQEINKLNIPIKLHHGSEIHLVPETVDQLLENKALTYCGLGKAALIELPKSTIPTGTESILSELIYNDITPIIAHPERNSSLRRDHLPLLDWIEFGCLSQLTGQSCTGDFGESIQKFSFQLIAKNLSHFVASDAHRPEGRNPNLKGAYKTISDKFDQNIAQALLYDNPLKLIQGQYISSLEIDTQNFQHFFDQPKKSIKSKKRKLFNFFN